jgi:hypothetical protein
MTKRNFNHAVIWNDLKAVTNAASNPNANPSLNAFNSRLSQSSLNMNAGTRNTFIKSPKTSFETSSVDEKVSSSMNCSITDPIVQIFQAYEAWDLILTVSEVSIIVCCCCSTLLWFSRR